MANTFKNRVSKDVGTSVVEVYTVPSAATAIINAIYVANVHTEAIQVDVSILDTSAATEVYLVKSAQVEVGGSLIPTGNGQKPVLETGDKIKVVSNAATSADVYVSLLEIT